MMAEVLVPRRLRAGFGSAGAKTPVTMSAGLMAPFNGRERGEKSTEAASGPGDLLRE